MALLLRSLADWIESGGKARTEHAQLDFELAGRLLSESALAPGTRKNYADALLAAYLGVLFDRDLAPPSAELVVAAVRRAARDCAAPARSAPRAAERFRREGAGRGRG